MKVSGVTHKEINDLLDRLFGGRLKGLHYSLLSGLDCIYATDCTFIYPFAVFLSLLPRFDMSVPFSVVTGGS